MIRPDHPVVRAMAEEAARESLAAVPQDESARSLWADLSPRAAYRVVEHHTALLLDFTRPATCDAWIRWGRKFALDAVLSGDPDRILRDGPSVARWGEHLRDNPAALEAAVSAALETM